METLLEHSSGNPRNSEGCFEKLKDGTIVFAYTRYTGDNWADHASADIVLIRSKDGGISWSKPEILVKNTKQNVMSASLLRLQSGRILLVYCEKSMVGDTEWIDCRPWAMYSDDEMESWSAPINICPAPPFYMCNLNDCLIQTENGRIYCPGSWHRYTHQPPYGRGQALALFFYSDDDGVTWDQTPDCCIPPKWLTGFAEPGMIELEKNRLMAWFRTGAGSQYKSYSYDNGMTWSEVAAAPEFKSPGAPLSMKRNPANGDIYAVWNDYYPTRSVSFEPGIGGRTPLVIGISSDNGLTWRHHTIEDSPVHGFSYTAMFFNGDDLLLGYCCGGLETCQCMLQDLKIRIIKWKELD